LALAEQEPKRCVLIDARGGKDEIAKKVWSVVSAKLDPATVPVRPEHAVR
jgi:thymidylate kinase